MQHITVHAGQIDTIARHAVLDAETEPFCDSTPTQTTRDSAPAIRVPFYDVVEHETALDLFRRAAVRLSYEDIIGTQTGERLEVGAAPDGEPALIILNATLVGA
ncbi:hypothetical protein AB0395_48305 [Streptosporangium sp. NPDC051023]|uniref:hypothetical protein n=1 Tax=Streptosporangium sp. NPDC051023 TaxID=3155410 RepID=UPI00344F12FF